MERKEATNGNHGWRLCGNYFISKYIEIREIRHGFIHRVQHVCVFSIVVPLIIHILPNVWKESYTISPSIFVDVPYWPHYGTDKFISCIVPCLSQWFFHFGEEIIIAWTHIGGIRWMFQNLPLPAAQKFRGSSSSGVTPCIVMKNDGVLYHQVSSFSPEFSFEKNNLA